MFFLPGLSRPHPPPETEMNRAKEWGDKKRLPPSFRVFLFHACLALANAAGRDAYLRHFVTYARRVKLSYPLASTASRI